LQADFGKFASNLGLETNYAKDNDHYSRAYLFDFLPFYHTGLRLTYPVTDRLIAMYMLTNGIQQTEERGSSPGWSRSCKRPRSRPSTGSTTGS